jgi:hypothetical protein
MGQGLVDGLNSKLGAVQAAAARLASAAAAALNAAAVVRSPSKLTIYTGEMIGAGLALGMRRSESDVERAARSLMDNVVDVADGIEGVFAGDQWAADFNARMNAELADTSVDPAAAPGGGRTINNIINNYVPDAERGADKALHGMRRLEALGLFGE